MTSVACRHGMASDRGYAIRGSGRRGAACRPCQSTPRAGACWSLLPSRPVPSSPPRSAARRARRPRRRPEFCWSAWAAPAPGRPVRLGCPALAEDSVLQGEPVHVADHLEDVLALDAHRRIADQPVDVGEGRRGQGDPVAEDVMDDGRFGGEHRYGRVADELHGVEVAVGHRPQEPLVGDHTAREGEVEARQPPQVQPDLGMLRDVVRRNGCLFTGVEGGTAGMLTLGVPEPPVDGPSGPLLGLGVVHSW